MYLPSLPDISQQLGTSDANTQQTLSVFLFGFAAGMLVYGPLADRLGRKPVLLSGLGLFVIATLVCTFSPSIEFLIAGRFVQAVGAAGPVVLARAIVRDLYRGAEAGRMLSHMGAIMGVVPAIAPVLGGMLHEAFGWRINFALTALLALALLWLGARALPETLRAGRRAPPGLAEIMRSYGRLLQNRVFVFYVGGAALAFAGLFAFISGSSFVFQDVYGLSPRLYGLSFAFMVAGYITGTLIGARLTMRLGLDQVINRGALLLLLGGLSMALMVFFSIAGAWNIILPMAVYSAGVGMVLPQCMAGALSPFPEKAGTASSLLGFLQTLAGAGAGIVAGHNLANGAWGLAALIALLGSAAFLLVAGQRLPGGFRT
jgi:DHA1 family bicyclomycin/chloramphenicol resistance-like MFS transporter